MTHKLYLNGNLEYQTKYLYNLSLIIVNQYLKSILNNITTALMRDLVGLLEERVNWKGIGKENELELKKELKMEKSSPLFLPCEWTTM